jgi:hypothetical protein
MGVIEVITSFNEHVGEVKKVGGIDDEGRGKLRKGGKRSLLDLREADHMSCTRPVYQITMSMFPQVVPDRKSAPLGLHGGIRD